MIKHLSCQDARDAISAKLDGMLDAETQVALEAHLNGCEACADHARDLGFLGDALVEQLDADFDPEPVWNRVRSVLDAGEAVARETTVPAMTVVPLEKPHRTRRDFLRYGMAASVLLAAGVGGGLYATRDGAAAVVTETVNDYLTFRASGKALHVAGAVPSEIERWLEERIDFDLSIGGGPSDFRLAGGRLCSFLGRRLAALHFTDGTHAGYRDASLYVMREDGLALPNAETRGVAGREVILTRERGIGIAIWKSRGLLHLAVSPMTESELLGFAASV